jgi:repressor LexA
MRTSKSGRPPSYLTERQKAILEFIAEYQQRHGISPTHREIREEFGYSSFGTVYKHLKLLQNKGFLRRDWNQKRGLELLRTVPGHIGDGQQSEVPFLGLIAAGQPIEALPGNDRLAVPNHLFGGSPTDHYVLRVTGDSMIQEGIYDGDFVIVLKREQAQPGEMVVALVGGVEATLKHFFPEGAQVRLQPANPEMQPIRVPASEVKVQGVVVGLMRKF